MTSGLSLLEFLRAVNGATAAGTNAPGFVLNALDAMRAVEFIHEYQVPVSLLAEHGASTMLVVPPAAATVSATPQIVTLHATVTNTTTVNGGSVIFTVRQADGSAVGASATSDAVISGAASAAYVLPALTPAQLLTITAAYSGAAGFAPSVATSTLTVTISDPCAATLSPTTTTAEALGGTMTVSLTIAGACAWSASADAPWLSVSSPSGTGSATIEYVVERNVSGVTRTGHVIVANQLLIVTQPPVPLLTSDFTGDGHGDLLWQHATGTLAVWTLNGIEPTNGYYLIPSGVSDPDWRVVGTADFNHDGSPDLLWHHRASGSVAVWYMEGITAVGGAHVLASSDLALRLVTTADMNRDGWTDLIWQDRNDGHLVITHLQGTLITTSESVAVPGADSGWMLMTAADLNGDTQVDLIWKHQIDGRVIVSLMQGSSVVSTEAIVPAVPDPAWQIVSAADLNADGSLDLVWQHLTIGAVTVWWMTGLEPSGSASIGPAVDAAWSLVSIH